MITSKRHNFLVKAATPLLVFLLVFTFSFGAPRKAEAVPIVFYVAIAVAGAVAVDALTCQLNVIWGCGGGGDGGGGGGGGSSPSNASFTASDTSILSGEVVTLTWDASGANADSCSGVNFSTGGAVSGSTDVAPEETTTYTLRCSNQGGTAETSVTVTVSQAELSISANPDRIDNLETTTITWEASNVDSCTVSEDNPDINDSWSGASGTEETSQMTAETIYTLTCETEGFNTSESVRVRLIPFYEEF